MAERLLHRPEIDAREFRATFFARMEHLGNR
jgi:hypothetical protein